MKPNVLDLFCGCGGFTTGLEQSGLNMVAGIDIWDKAIENYKQNHSHIAICDDLTILTPENCEKKYGISNIDILVGSPPCQTFSLAGSRDKTDPRNSLFMEYIKYLDYFNPSVFLFENVVGILSKKTDNGENVIDIILSYMTTNYNCVVAKLFARDFEVPQIRRRVIIIGIRKDLGIVPTEPIKIGTLIPVSSVLLDKGEIDKKYFLSERAIAGILKKKEIMKSKSFGFGAQIINPDNVCYTIPARYWKDGYDALVQYSDVEIRRLTILELKRIQTFPDTYILNGSNKDVIMQIGNAVACRFAYHLGKYVLDIFEKLKLKTNKLD
jgi:DNA (cytosine-5)-methyltransferase 1